MLAVTNSECWHEELGLGAPPTLLRHGSRGDAEAIRFLVDHFPEQFTPVMRRETALMAEALVDAHWGSVQRLVETLCVSPLPVRISG